MVHTATFIEWQLPLKFYSIYSQRLLCCYRFERLKSERTATNEEHLEAIRHMTLQNESVAATFKVN